jgi:hypothetical protein
MFIHIKTPDSVATTYMNYVKADKLKVKFNNEDICKLSYNDTIYALKGVMAQDTFLLGQFNTIARVTIMNYCGDGKI